MNFIKTLFAKKELPSADTLSTLNLDKPFDSIKYADKVIRHLANAIIETNRQFKYQHDVKVIFNCGYDESYWIGGSNYYVPIKMRDTSIDFEARVITEIKSKGYAITNREYIPDKEVLYFSISWN